MIVSSKTENSFHEFLFDSHPRQASLVLARCLAVASALWLLFFCGSCQNVEQKIIFVDKEVEKYIDIVYGSATKNNSALVLADRGDYRLEISADAIDEFNRQLGDSTLYLARLGARSKTQLDLIGEHRPQAIIYEPEKGGVVLLRDPGPTTLLELAGAAHHEADGLPCGRIELVPSFLLNSVDRTPQQHIHARYDEHRKLSHVSELLEKVSAQRIDENIKRLSEGPSRVHNSEKGVEFPRRLADLIKERFGGDLSLQFELLPLDEKLSHQPNLRVILPALKEKGEIVIVGAHMDSITVGLATDQAPGADDDASGMAVILEMLAVLAESGASFERQVEFHFYAAEEVGLIGSMDMANRFRLAKNKVVAMLQFDLAAYTAPGDPYLIYLVENDTSPILSRSLKSLMTTYLIGGYKSARLSAGTSDHRSWHLRGYPTAFPFESPNNVNPMIHTENDRIDFLDAEFAARFAKLGLAAVSHLAGLMSASEEYLSAESGEKLGSDIKVAIFYDSGASSRQRIRVATKANVKQLELCAITKENQNRCTGEFHVLDLLHSRNERNFFAVGQNDALDLASSEAFGLFGYDSQDKLVERRLFEFARK